MAVTITPAYRDREYPDRVSNDPGSCIHPQSRVQSARVLLGSVPKWGPAQNGLLSIDLSCRVLPEHSSWGHWLTWKSLDLGCICQLNDRTLHLVSLGLSWKTCFHEGYADKPPFVRRLAMDPKLLSSRLTVHYPIRMRRMLLVVSGDFRHVQSSVRITGYGLEPMTLEVPAHPCVGFTCPGLVCCENNVVEVEPIEQPVIRRSGLGFRERTATFWKLADSWI